MNETPSHNEAKNPIERSHRLRIIMIILPIMMGLLLWLILFWYRYILPEYTTNFILIFIIILLGASGLVAVTTYLQTGFKRPTEVEFETLKYQRKSEENSAAQRVEMLQLADALRAELHEARVEIENAKSRASNFDVGDRTELVAELKAQIAAEANSSILNDLKAQVAAAYSRDVRDKDLLQRFDGITPSPI